MDLGELVFNLNVRTEGLMAGVDASISRMDQLMQSEDATGRTAGVLQTRMQILSRAFEAQRDKVREANAAYAETVAAQGLGSRAAREAEAALMKELEALQRLAERLNATSGSATRLAQSNRQLSIETISAFTAMSAIASRVLNALIDAVGAGIDAYNKYTNSLRGLSSVAAGVGVSTEATKAGLDKLTDAFFSSTAAATSMKNLLTRGYSLDQAIAVINRLKDAAAFGRQASLSLSDAVQSATEGLKNENSILVDNAGVTKNVSKMWAEYAASIGVSAQSLSQVQKVEAEYQGIMNETRYQVGDMDKLMNELSGTQAQAAMTGELLSRAYGQAMAPSIRVGTFVLNEFLEIMRGIVASAPGMASGLTVAATAAGGLFIVSKLAILFQDFIARMTLAQAAATGFAKAMYTSMPWLLAIAAAIGVIVGIYTEAANAAERSAKAQEEAIQKRAEELQSNKEMVSSLENLRDRYEELSKKKQLTYSESRDMRQMEQELAEKYGLNVSVLGDLASAYDTVAAAIRNKRAETVAEMQATLEANFVAAKETQATMNTEGNSARQKAAALDALSAAYDTLTDKQKASVNVIDSVRLAMLRMLTDDQMNVYAQATKLMSTYDRAFITDFTSQLAVLRAGVKDTLDAERQAMVDSALAAMDLVDNSLTALNVPETFKAKMREIVQSMDFSGGLNADAFVDRYAALLQNADVMPAVTAMQEMNTKIFENGVISDADKEKYISSYRILYDALIGSEGTGLLPSYTSDWASFFDTMTNGMLSVSNVAQTNAGAWEEYWDSISREAMQNITSEGLDSLVEKVETSSKEMRRLATEAKDLSNIMDAIAFIDTNQIDLSAPYESQTAAAQKAIDTLQEYYTVSLSIPGTYDQVKKAADSYKATLDSTSASLQTYYSQLIAAMEAMKASGVDAAGNALTENDINVLNSTMAAYVLARESLAQSLDYAGDPFSTEYIDKAIEGAKTLGDGYRSLAGEMKDSQIKMDVLTTMSELWGDKESEAFQAAGEEAEKLYGYKIQQQETANALLEDEHDRWDSLSARWKATSTAYNTMIGLLQVMRASVADNTTEALNLDQAITTLKGDTLSMLAAANSGWAGVESGALSAYYIYNDLKGSIDAVGEAMQSIRLKQDAIKDAKVLVEESKRLKAAGREVSDTWRQKVSQALGRDFTGTLEDATDALSSMGISLDTAFGGMKDQLDAWESQIQAAMAAEISETLRIHPNATVDTTKYQAALAIINAWRALLGLPKMDAPSGSGGGGGGKSPYKKELDAMAHEISMDRMTLEEQLAALEALNAKFRNRKGKSTLKKDDQLDLEERIYDLQKQIREKNLQNAYDALDHQKALGQVSLAQEIELLNSIRAAHELSGEDLLDWEERLYAAEQALQEDAYQSARDLVSHRAALGEITVAQEIDMLREIVNAYALTGDQLWDITEEIYAKQQQLQEEALSKQQSAVKTVYGKIVEALKARYAAEKEIEQAAIDEKIAALQDQTDAENEAKRVQEYEEDLAEKQRQLRLTKSARERRELQKEIDDMVAAEALRQAQLARQEEIDALQEEKESIKDKYAALTDEENLRQEALRIVMSDNLQAMTDLIASYGSAWEDAGESLAQYLTEGLNSEKQRVIDTMTGLMSGLDEIVASQLQGVISGVPEIASRLVTVNLYGAVFEKDVDVTEVINAINRALARSQN